MTPRAKKTGSKAKSAKTVKSSEDFDALKRFPIVGIGASAGGLEAISQLLSNLPRETGMAFVVIQHLDPKHESSYREILARTTQMPVIEVKKRMQAEPNHVYLISPNSDLAIINGILSPLPRFEIRGLHLPIDFFFQSLAQDQKSQAIGIVLSGTASDGTQGLRSIKAEGGITCAQDPKSAKHRGMPENAIASGIVDFVLPPNQLAAELARLAHHPYITTGSLKETSETDRTSSEEVLPLEESYRRIFLLLRKQMRVDFSNYKKSTIKRRVQRRMLVHKITDTEDYVRLLQDHPEELKALYEDVLIHVTGFFRDAESFEAFRKLVFPKLIENRPPHLPLRFWVAGCSTGEEAYSLAILSLEFLEEVGAKNSIQIFATDISDAAIQKARAGYYPDSIVKDLSKSRLTRYFDKIEDGYRVSKAIRDICLFSKHDVTSDPPFAKLDLISCRNLLIYFESSLQKKVIPVFHYALQPGGFLWLGRSEGPAGFSDLFHQMDKTHRIYSKIGVTAPYVFQFPLKPNSEEKHELDKPSPHPSLTEHDLEKDAERIILSQYSPPAVIVNQEMTILHFLGKLAPFLEPPSGQPSHNLLKVARPELVPGLRMAIQAAKKQNALVRKEEISFQFFKNIWTVNLIVIPIYPALPIKDRRFLILFEKVSSLSQLEIKKKSVQDKKGGKGYLQSVLQKRNQQIAELQKELKDTHEYQQSLATEKEISQEELTAANEGLQSANEELQSSNEELETAKEELQSSNEELSTVNDELQNRNLELARFSNDLNNLIASTDIPIVMIGSDYRIRQFTPPAGKAFNLIPSDIGRPIGDIKANFDLDLEVLASEVIATINSKEVEIQDRDGRWQRIQVRPYKTIDRKIDGAVIALVDIEALKEKLKISDIELNYAQSVAETVQLPLVVLGRNLDFRSANRSFYEHFKISEEVIGRNFFEILGFQKEKTILNKLMKDTLLGQPEFKGVELTHEFPQVGLRAVLFSGRKIRWAVQEPESILVSLEDITEKKAMAVKLALESSTVRLFETIATAASEASTLEEALQIFLDRICVHTGWPVGHAYLTSDTLKGEFVSSKIWHLNDPSKYKAFRKATEETTFTLGMGFSGHVAYVKRPDWTFDFSKDPILSRRLLSQDIELKVAIAFPVPVEKDVLAILEFFSTNPKEPNQGLLRLMTHISPQLGRVIERMRVQKERTDLLLREQRARAEAEKANQAKDLFLATLSHELRTPLTTILSWSQLLRMGKLDAEKTKKGVEMIEQSAQAQNRLINDLLDVSRIIMDKLPLELSTVDPAQVVRAAIELIQPMADKKSIQIEMNVNRLVGMVSADPMRLRQVIWNLLANSIKFSPQGKPIHVSLDPLQTATGEFVSIKIVDEGKGISPEFLPHLFNRFSQADTSSTRIHGGLGLGLALVRNLVELHKGTVKAESAGEGKGATFTVHIPMVLSEMARSPNFQMELEIPNEKKNDELVRLDGLRVLLVDDEVDTCEALTVMLRTFGAEVKYATSSKEALELLTKFSPNILISDIAMPGEDGYSFIRKMRSLGQKGQIPSLALTAFATAEDVKHALEAGFQAHLAKPVDVRKLVSTVVRLTVGTQKGYPLS